MVGDAFPFIFKDDQAVAINVGNPDIEGFRQICGRGSEFEHIVNHIVADDPECRSREICLGARCGAVEIRMHPAASERVKAVFDIIGKVFI